MINLKKFLKKNKFLFALGFIAVVLIILKSLFLKTEKTLPQPMPTPTPSPGPAYKPPLFSPSPSPLPAGIGDPELLKSLLKETQEQFPLIDFLPYENDNFSVDYIGPLKLQVLFKTPQASQSAVLDWIRSKDVDPNSHQLEFAIF